MVSSIKKRGAENLKRSVDSEAWQFLWSGRTGFVEISDTVHSIYFPIPTDLVIIHAEIEKLSLIFERGAFFGPLARKENLGSARSKKENITDEDVLVWIDVDFYKISELHGFGSQQVMELVFEALKSKNLPLPAVVATSGRGLHLYWKLSKPLPAEKLSEINKRLVGILQHLGAEGGATTAVTAIMRLWGSLNPRNGAKVRVLYFKPNISPVEPFLALLEQEDMENILEGKQETVRGEEDKEAVLDQLLNWFLQHKEIFKPGVRHLIYANIGWLLYSRGFEVKEILHFAEKLWHLVESEQGNREPLAFRLRELQEDIAKNIRNNYSFQNARSFFWGLLKETYGNSYRAYEAMDQFDTILRVSLLERFTLPLTVKTGRETLLVFTERGVLSIYRSSSKSSDFSTYTSLSFYIPVRFRWFNWENQDYFLIEWRSPGGEIKVTEGQNLTELSSQAVNFGIFPDKRTAQRVIWALFSKLQFVGAIKPIRKPFFAGVIERDNGEIEIEINEALLRGLDLNPKEFGRIPIHGDKNDLEQGLSAIIEFCRLYPAFYRFLFTAGWLIQAGVDWIRRKYRKSKFLLLVGAPNVGKSIASAHLLSGLWKIPMNVAKMGFGSIGTVARLARLLSKLTYPLIIDEAPSGVFDSGIWARTLKSGLDAGLPFVHGVAEASSSKLRYKFKLLRSLIFTSNDVITFSDPGLAVRAVTLEFGEADILFKNMEEEEKRLPDLVEKTAELKPDFDLVTGYFLNLYNRSPSFRKKLLLLPPERASIFLLKTLAEHAGLELPLQEIETLITPPELRDPILQFFRLLFSKLTAYARKHGFSVNFNRETNELYFQGSETILNLYSFAQAFEIPLFAHKEPGVIRLSRETLRWVGVSGLTLRDLARRLHKDIVPHPKYGRTISFTTPELVSLLLGARAIQEEGGETHGN